MNEVITKLLDNNQAWVAEMLATDDQYFEKMATGQQPHFLWIGCSDSRVPPDQITKTHPGEIFTHRNIANLVVQTDMNLLSVLQYSVEVLKVEHIIVCGHYGCGGVRAAMGDHQYGLIDNWIRQIKDTQNYYWAQLKELPEPERENRLVELNVIEQVYNLGKTNIIQNAWRDHQAPALHGWVYDIKTGRIKPQTGQINTLVKALFDTSTDLLLSLIKYPHHLHGFNRTPATRNTRPNGPPEAIVHAFLCRNVGAFLVLRHEGFVAGVHGYRVEV
jgi:carbonic anhydrase